jgi:putative transposase
MKRHRHTPERVVRKLREGGRLPNEGSDRTTVLRTLEISEATWNRWRARYGGMMAGEAKRLKECEAENARLKTLVPTRRWTHGVNFQASPTTVVAEEGLCRPVRSRKRRRGTGDREELRAQRPNHVWRWTSVRQSLSKPGGSGTTLTDRTSPSAT